MNFHLLCYELLPLQDPCCKIFAVANIAVVFTTVSRRKQPPKIPALWSTKALLSPERVSGSLDGRHGSCNIARSSLLIKNVAVWFTVSSSLPHGHREGETKGITSKAARSFLVRTHGSGSHWQKKAADSQGIAAIVAVHVRYVCRIVSSGSKSSWPKCSASDSAFASHIHFLRSIPYCDSAILIFRNVCWSYRLLSASHSPHLPSYGLQSPENTIPVPVNLLHQAINASSTPRALFFSTSPKPDGTEYGSEEAKASVGAGSSGQAEAKKQTNGSGLESEVDFSRDGREFVVENFAKGLLDVVDDLRRMSFVGNDKFSKIDASKGLDGADSLLKKLHACLQGAEKQVAEVVKKCDEFDPECGPCGPDRDGAILELQKFAKSLVDVANNLGRASSVAKDKFLSIDAFKKSEEAVPILKTLLEAVEITEKQLDEVFEKIGLEKINSKQELYNPDRHEAIIQFPVSSQPPGTIIAVLKAGYLLHGRLLRRAEVATTREVTDQDRADDAMTPGMNDEDGGFDKEESESLGQRTG
ncbi:uncharacterized protein LOC129302650 [Prosopis cineraria]|uniref:uncharacterized protein LOC129302650 n=1 Tax=Prosopis cineraria TaxID=364024 RepID=UPI00240FE9CC|nr:uncharacterized protein LOC129302650 [Prosopis cineraria]